VRGTASAGKSRKRCGAHLVMLRRWMAIATTCRDRNIANAEIPEQPRLGLGFRHAACGG
jgi:hypothetical protein